MTKLINQSNLRRILKQKGVGIGKEAAQKLEYKFDEILNAAVNLTKINKRKIMLERDIL